MNSNVLMSLDISITEMSGYYFLSVRDSLKDRHVVYQIRNPSLANLIIRHLQDDVWEGIDAHVAQGHLTKMFEDKANEFGIQINEVFKNGYEIASYLKAQEDQSYA